MKTKIFAHRGASAYCPENTMEAFQLAIDQGADGFELDIHLSKDGHVVVTHDFTLERLSNGNGRVCDHDLADMKKLNFNQLFPGQPSCLVPTLTEVYALVADTSLIINVELKTTDEFYSQMPAKLIQLEQEYGMIGRVTYSSFNHYSLMAIKKLNPGAKIELLYSLGLVDPWVYAKYLSADAINPHYRIIKALPDTVARCHENGIKVNVWTVDSPEDMALMLKLGVDCIITNKPDVALRLRN
ncbi:MAG: glycerophosphodiester phosphodiesterase [Firmicutes bacterium]|nr:glycerophosphodiester phosphodiesterase [Bacillota bacterium]